MTKAQKARQRRSKATRRRGSANYVTWRGKKVGVLELAAKGAAKLSKAYGIYQSGGPRDAIYVYLAAVLEFAEGFSSSGSCKRVGRCMIEANGGRPVRTQQKFSLLIGATATTTDQRIRWKWARCLERAESDRFASGELKDVIQFHGGVNDYATYRDRGFWKAIS